MIVIVDYGSGNLQSIKNGFSKIGADSIVSSSINEIADAEALILPGVGAFGNAMENLERNAPTGDVAFLHGSMEQVSGVYDIILSNITKNDNLALLPSYRNCLQPGGRLVLSGFYSDDLEAMKTGLSLCGFEAMDSRIEDEWLAVTAKPL